MSSDYRTYEALTDIWGRYCQPYTPSTAAGVYTATGDCTTKISFSFDTELPKIKKVIFNEPATIVIWDDKTKTIVKCQDGDVFDKEKGLAMAIVKKLYGENRGKYNNIINKWVGNS